MNAGLEYHSSSTLQWDLHGTLVPDRDVDPLLRGSRSFALGTLNITSLYSFSAQLLDFPASLVAVQETKLCQGDIAVLGSLRVNWQLFHPELPLGTGDRRVRSGSVMLMADRAWQAQHRASSYHLVGAVYYGRPKMQNQTLEDLAQLAAHLHTYDVANVAILGDFNLDATGRTPRYLADFLLDAHWFVAQKAGMVPGPTCITPTSTSRADGLYCTPSIMELICGCEALDWGTLPVHRPLIFELQCQSCMTWFQRPSRSIVTESSYSPTVLRTALQEIDPPALERTDLDGALTQWTKFWKRAIGSRAGLLTSMRCRILILVSRWSIHSQWASVLAPCGCGD
eukprot:3288733-Amphidinium_carterae.3